MNDRTQAAQGNGRTPEVDAAYENLGQPFINALDDVVVMVKSHEATELRAYIAQLEATASAQAERVAVLEGALNQIASFSLINVVQGVSADAYKEGWDNLIKIARTALQRGQGETNTASANAGKV